MSNRIFIPSIPPLFSTISLYSHTPRRFSQDGSELSVPGAMLFMSDEIRSDNEEAILTFFFADHLLIFLFPYFNIFTISFREFVDVEALAQFVICRDDLGGSVFGDRRKSDGDEWNSVEDKRFYRWAKRCYRCVWTFSTTLSGYTERTGTGAFQECEPSIYNDDFCWTRLYVIAGHLSFHQG